MTQTELRMVELSEEKWHRHLRSVRRALVLLARLQNGEKIRPEEADVVSAARRDLREVADLIEATLDG